MSSRSYLIAIFGLAALLSSSTAGLAVDDASKARIAKLIQDQDFDHLKPETPFLGFSMFDPDLMRRDYPEAFRPEISARVFAELSFCCTVMTTLEKQTDAYRVVNVTVPHGSDATKNSRCETTIPMALGDRIVMVWQAVLQRTRYGKVPQADADGATYVFASSFMTGRTWSPPPGTVPGKLVRLADELGTVCEEKTDTTKLESMTSALEADLVHYQ